MIDGESAGSDPDFVDGSEGTTDPSDASPSTDPSTTWASTGGGLERLQEGDSRGWPPGPGQLEELGKALRGDE